MPLFGNLELLDTIALKNLWFCVCHLSLEENLT